MCIARCLCIHKLGAHGNILLGFVNSLVCFEHYIILQCTNQFGFYM